MSTHMHTDNPKSLSLSKDSFQHSLTHEMNLYSCVVLFHVISQEILGVLQIPQLNTGEIENMF